MPTRTTAPPAAPHTAPLYRLTAPCALGEAQHLGDLPRRTLSAGTVLYVRPAVDLFGETTPVAVELVAEVPATVDGVRGAVEAALVFLSAPAGRYHVVRRRYAGLADSPTAPLVIGEQTALNL